MTPVTVSIQAQQFFLKGWGEDFMTMLTQEHQQFRAADPLDNRLFSD